MNLLARGSGDSGVSVGERSAASDGIASLVVSSRLPRLLVSTKSSLLRKQDGSNSERNSERNMA